MLMQAQSYKLNVFNDSSMFVDYENIYQIQ